MKIYLLNLSDSQRRLHSIWNAKNNSRKALDVLSGIILGIIADGSINSSEVTFFREWISSNQDELPQVLTEQLLPLLFKIENSKELNQDEHNELLEVILGFSGANEINNEEFSCEKENTSSNIGKTADWYFYKGGLAISDLSNCEFSLTGDFLSGTKSEIAKKFISISSSVIPKQPRKNTDFLIVGGKGSDQWAYSQLGNSIIKAISMQEQGHHIRIIKESTFLKIIDELS